MKNRNNKKGFTLVEVLVVVLIIGILAAIAVPSYNFAVEKTRAKQGIISLTQIAKAQYTYNAKKGNYSDNMLNLPLDMKDSDGSDATGAEFADKFFDYKIFGDEFERARATRNTGEYELSVEYETGQLFCRPIEHKICQDLNLEEGEELISWPQKVECEPEHYGYNSSEYYCIRTLFKDGTKEDKICGPYKEGSSGARACYTYNNDERKIQEVVHNGQFLSFGKYDPNTGVRIEVISRKENGNGAIATYIVKDPITGKTLVAAWGNREFYFYDDDSGEATSMLYFDDNGTPLYLRVWDYSTGSAKTVGNTIYYPSGKVKSYDTFNLSGQVMESVNYDEDGNVTSHICNSGACKQDGYVVPPQGTARISRPDMYYCQLYEEDEEFCVS